MSKRLEKKKRLANFEIEKIRENFFIPRSFDRKLLGILCQLEARQSANMHEKLLPKKQSLEKEAELLPIIAEFLAFDPK